MQEVIPPLLCAYHPDQAITNFCFSAHCLLPLCPKCIPIHNSEHYATNQHSCIQSINDSIQSTSQDIKQRLRQLSATTSSLQKNKNLIIGNLTNLDKDILQFSQQLFKQIHNQIQKLVFSLQEIIKEQTKSYLSKYQNINKYIEALTLQYQDHIQEMYSENALCSLITYHSESKARLRTGENQVAILFDDSNFKVDFQLKVIQAHIQNILKGVKSSVQIVKRGIKQPIVYPVRTYLPANVVQRVESPIIRQPSVVRQQPLVNIRSVSPLRK